MTDLTAAVEAAARGLGRHISGVRFASVVCACGWSGASHGDHRSHAAAAAVAAAAPILRAQVLAEAREAVERHWWSDDALAAIDALGEQDVRPGEVTHELPPGQTAVTPCCGRTPFELPTTDRMTWDRALVTCPAAIDALGAEGAR